MKINRLVYFFTIMMLITTAGWAIPPSEINLEFDAKSKLLKIAILHISTNVRDHHIRKIEVFKNEESIQVIRLVTQSSAREVLQDVSIDVKDGDVIRVKAICNEAGIKEESITIKLETSDEKSEDIQKPASVQTIPTSMEQVNPKPSSSKY